MSWNYRVIRQKIDDEEWYAFHEVYYDNDGPESVTENPIPAGGETLEELREVLMMQRRALAMPVLDYDSF